MRKNKRTNFIAIEDSQRMPEFCLSQTLRRWLLGHLHVSRRRQLSLRAGLSEVCRQLDRHRVTRRNIVVDVALVELDDQGLAVDARRRGRNQSRRQWHLDLRIALEGVTCRYCEVRRHRALYAGKHA